MFYINPVVGMENGRGELCLIFKLTILDCFPIANPVKSLASISQNIFCQNNFQNYEYYHNYAIEYSNILMQYPISPNGKYEISLQGQNLRF